MPLSISNKRVGHILSLLAALFFALNVPATTYILDRWLTPTTYALLRVLGGVTFCWVVSIFLPKQPPIEHKDFLPLALAGILGMGCFFLFYAMGMERTSPIDASIILTLSPVVVLLVSALFLKEKITARKLLGIAIAMGGALLVIVFQGDNEPDGSVVGNLLVLGAAIFYGSYLVYTGKLSHRYHPIIMLRWIFLFAFLLYFPLFIEPFSQTKLVQHPELIPVLVALFIAFLPSALAFLLLPLAMKSLATTTVSMYNYSIPVIASGVSIALGQDKLHWIDPVAVVFVVLGVYLVTINKQKG